MLYKYTLRDSTGSATRERYKRFDQWPLERQREVIRAAKDWAGWSKVKVTTIGRNGAMILLPRATSGITDTLEIVKVDQ